MLLNKEKERLDQMRSGQVRLETTLHDRFSSVAYFVLFLTLLLLILFFVSFKDMKLVIHIVQ